LHIAFFRQAIAGDIVLWWRGDSSQHRNGRGGWMLVGEIKSQIQSIWNDFWAGGLANPLAVMEQITYLLFIKRLDELQTLEEAKSTTLNIPLERGIFPEGFDGRRTRKPGETICKRATYFGRRRQGEGRA
jgi:HsdM N-terminal domain